MGRSYTPRYSITIHEKDSAPLTMAWNTNASGKPTEANLEKYIHVLIDSYKIGGANEHISRNLGRIPVPHYAYIRNQWAGNKTIIVSWKAPSFMVI